LWETDEGLAGALIFSTALFDVETVARIGEQFISLLALVVAEPELKLSELRVRLGDIGHARQNAQAERLADASHERLRSTKRRPVDSAAAVASGGAEKLETV
jgi:hypothetical protein